MSEILTDQPPPLRRQAVEALEEEDEKTGLN
jgi:hypothetical protein